MSRLALQFHADPEELLGELLPKWIGDVDVRIAVEPTLGAPERREISVSDVRDGDLRGRPVGRLFLHKHDFRSLDEAAPAFQRANPGFFAVTPGTRGTDGLRETIMGSAVPDADWKRLIARARRDLRRGAMAIDPGGGRHIDATHYYSPGAIELNAAGVPMLAIAGSVTFELPTQEDAALE